jgi:hypothetical protein
MLKKPLIPNFYNGEDQKVQYIPWSYTRYIEFENTIVFPVIHNDDNEKLKI